MEKKGAFKTISPAAHAEVENLHEENWKKYLESYCERTLYTKANSLVDPEQGFENEENLKLPLTHFKGEDLSILIPVIDKKSERLFSMYQYLRDTSRNQTQARLAARKAIIRLPGNKMKLLRRVSETPHEPAADSQIEEAGKGKEKEQGRQLKLRMQRLDARLPTVIDKNGLPEGVPNKDENFKMALTHFKREDSLMLNRLIEQKTNILFSMYKRQIQDGLAARKGIIRLPGNKFKFVLCKPSLMDPSPAKAAPAKRRVH